jgi:hypothetical protein
MNHWREYVQHKSECNTRNVFFGRRSGTPCKQCYGTGCIPSETCDDCIDCQDTCPTCKGVQPPLICTCGLDDLLADPVGGASPQLIPKEWADAANAARGLCESEAIRWESACPKTAEHWRSVATRLGALYLTQDHLAMGGASPAPGWPVEVEEARKALRCLYLEVSESVARDVGRRVEAAFTALKAAASSPSLETPK